MSKETFDQFRALVLDDESLQKELRDLGSRELLLARVVVLAGNCGLVVEAADVDEALVEARRTWLERWI